MKMKISRSILLIVLAFAITAGYKNAVESSKVTYHCENGYTATKISHPNKAVQTTDGIVDYTGNGTLGVNLENGQGDRGQNYSWGSIGYGDYMYIGTCYGAWLSTLSLMKSSLGREFDDDVMYQALDTFFHGTFYTGEDDGTDPLGVLLKVNVKTGEVKLLMSMDTTGTNCIFRNAVEFKDKLYFCGSVNTIPCIYQIDPKTDECKQVYAGMTLEEYYSAYQKGVSVGIRGMCVYDDKLIISCINTEGALICESKTPEDQSSFKVIATDKELFDYPAYHYTDSIYGGSIFDMTQYGKSLYVSICTGTPENRTDYNTMQSFALVRGDVNADGTWSWTSVAGDTEKDHAKYTYGIDPERTRSGAANLMVYGDYLYIGEYNDEEIAIERLLFDNNFDFMNANFEQSICFYRMDQEENVELVVGDADKMFPDGSLSGLGAGFGRHENQYIWKMQVYDGKLYVGTFDGSSFLEPLNEYVNDPNASGEWKKQAEYFAQQICQNYSGFPAGALECAQYLKDADRGFDLYVTEDGINFETVTTDGFGDPYNHGCRAFGVTNEGLFIGTANPFYGTQVWNLSKTDTPAPTESTESTEVASKTEPSGGNAGTSPKTGDAGAGVLPYMILGLSVLSMVLILLGLKRKEEA